VCIVEQCQRPLYLYHRRQRQPQACLCTHSTLHENRVSSIREQKRAWWLCCDMRKHLQQHSPGQIARFEMLHTMTARRELVFADGHKRINKNCCSAVNTKVNQACVIVETTMPRSCLARVSRRFGHSVSMPPLLADAMRYEATAATLAGYLSQCTRLRAKPGHV